MRLNANIGVSHIYWIVSELSALLIKLSQHSIISGNAVVHSSDNDLGLFILAQAFI